MPKRCIGVGSAEKSAEKDFPFRGNASEKKCASVPEVLPRMSISERKPVAGALQSRVPRPASVARKGLDFNYRPNMKGLKVKSSHFAKPFGPLGNCSINQNKMQGIICLMKEILMTFLQARIGHTVLQKLAFN